jgi:trans-aconitate 2-methyltransferase
MMSWDPSQYLKFAGERLRPAVDLLMRVPIVAPETVIDLGCGAGNLIPLLRQHWPHCQLTGVDSSTQMLDRARQDYPKERFVEADLASWRPEQPVDVMYSNSALHWVEGHEVLIPELLSAVKPGGFLAIQMPRNFAAPSHTCLADAIEQGPWRAKLLPYLRRKPVAELSYYFRLLHDEASTLELWESEYLHVLQGADPVAEYVKGSWLKQFLDRLDPSESSALEADYRARVRAAYPPQPGGYTLFPFRRMFIVAQRA